MARILHWSHHFKTDQPNTTAEDALPTANSRLVATALLALPSSAAQAEGPYRNPDNRNLNDVGEGSYLAPYKMPLLAGITASLGRIRRYLDNVTPTRVVRKKSGGAIGAARMLRHVDKYPLPARRMRVRQVHGTPVGRPCQPVLRHQAGDRPSAAL